MADEFDDWLSEEIRGVPARAQQQSGLARLGRQAAQGALDTSTSLAASLAFLGTGGEPRDPRDVLSRAQEEASQVASHVMEDPGAPQGLGESAARRAGAMLPTAALGVAVPVGTLPQRVVAELLALGGATAGGTAAEAAGAGPLGQAAAEVAGGMGAALSPVAPKAVSYFRARRMLKRNVLDTGEALQSLAKPQDLPEGVTITNVQRLADDKLADLQRAMADADPAFRRRLETAQRETGKALSREQAGIASDLVQRDLAELQDMTRTATEASEDAAEVLRTQVAPWRQARKNELYDAIDPNGEVFLDTSGLKAAVARVRSGLTQAEAADMPADLATIIEKYPAEVSFHEIQGLRRTLNRKIEAARLTDPGRAEALRALKMEVDSGINGLMEDGRFTMPEGATRSPDEAAAAFKQANEFFHRSSRHLVDDLGGKATGLQKSHGALPRDEEVLGLYAKPGKGAKSRARDFKRMTAYLRSEGQNEAADALEQSMKDYLGDQFRTSMGLEAWESADTPQTVRAMAGNAKRFLKRHRDTLAEFYGDEHVKRAEAYANTLRTLSRGRIAEKADVGGDTLAAGLMAALRGNVKDVAKIGTRIVSQMPASAKPRVLMNAMTDPDLLRILLTKLNPLTEARVQRVLAKKLASPRYLAQARFVGEEETQ